jgi:hypothetical protein
MRTGSQRANYTPRSRLSARRGGKRRFTPTLGEQLHCRIIHSICRTPSDANVCRLSHWKSELLGAADFTPPPIDLIKVITRDSPDDTNCCAIFGYYRPSLQDSREVRTATTASGTRARAAPAGQHAEVQPGSPDQAGPRQAPSHATETARPPCTKSTCRDRPLAGLSSDSGATVSLLS